MYKVERRKYDREFKLNAIQLYEEGDKKLVEVEQELGIGWGCLSHWRRQFKDEKENAFPGNGNIAEKDKEMARLIKENEILKQERDILKKAVGIFSKNQQ